jgi:hypothetical protein
MKKYWIIILLFFLNLVSSQTLKGVIKDSLSNNGLPYCNVVFMKSNSGVYSDENGLYKIDIQKNYNDTLKISSVGYEPKFIALAQFKGEVSVEFDVFLKEKVTVLDEVSVFRKAKIYKKTHSFGEEREGNTGMSTLIGYESVVYIENAENSSGKMKSVVLYLKRTENADFVAPLNIKFYCFDKENNRPGEALLKTNLIVKPRNRIYKLNIDVQDYNIPFPKDGICIGIELMDPKNESKKYDKIGPSFRLTASSSKMLTWSNYRNRGWKNGSADRNKLSSKHINQMIGVKVLMEK